MIPFARTCTVVLTQDQIDSLLRMVNSRIRRCDKYLSRCPDNPDANANHVRASIAKRAELQSLAKRLSNAAGRGNHTETPVAAAMPPAAEERICIEPMPCIECGLYLNECRCPPPGYADNLESP